MDAHTKQVIAFYVGDRSHQSAKKLWERIPLIYKCHATFYTDDWQAYQDVIPKEQHKAVSKQSGKTSIIERFNCTLRQRVSRLVRKALSFSKKLENHIGAIKYWLSLRLLMNNIKRENLVLSEAKDETRCVIDQTKKGGRLL